MCISLPVRQKTDICVAFTFDSWQNIARGMWTFCWPSSVRRMVKKCSSWSKTTDGLRSTLVVTFCLYHQCMRTHWTEKWNIRRIAEKFVHCFLNGDNKPVWLSVCKTMQDRANKGRNVFVWCHSGMKTKVELNGWRFEVIAGIQSETEPVLDIVAKWEFQREKR
jgi:hypothetical protein